MGNEPECRLNENFQISYFLGSGLMSAGINLQKFLWDFKSNQHFWVYVRSFGFRVYVRVFFSRFGLN